MTPRYYFHIRNSFGYLEDEEGTLLYDLDAVREFAIEAARSLLAAEAREGKMDLRGQVEVTDSHRNVVLVLPFAEAVAVRTGPLGANLKR